MEEEDIRQKWEDQPMLKPRVSKVAVNMSVGKSGEPLERAAKVLEELTNQRPIKRKAKQTLRDFGIRKGESIACMVTLRKEKALEFLKKAFQGVDNKISEKSFDKNGNFSFGIKEHINIPGTRYSPSLGIFGMDISVVVRRPGCRVKDRRRRSAKIGRNHLLTSEETMVLMKDSFGVEIV